MTKPAFTQFVNTDALKLFPRSTTKGVVVDERCACGHLRSNHEGIGPIAGHGACAQTLCNCRKFAWTSHVLQSKRRK